VIWMSVENIWPRARGSGEVPWISPDHRAFLVSVAPVSFPFLTESAPTLRILRSPHFGLGRALRISLTKSGSSSMSDFMLPSAESTSESALDPSSITICNFWTE